MDSGNEKLELESLLSISDLATLKFQGRFFCLGRGGCRESKKLARFASLVARLSVVLERFARAGTILVSVSTIHASRGMIHFHPPQIVRKISIILQPSVV